MNVRTTRDGVAEVFERDRVALIMQQALAHRYAHPLPSPLSDGVHDGHLVDSEGYGTATSGIAAKSPSSPPRLTCPLHYTLRRCSRTEYYLRFIPPISDTAGFMEPSTAGGSSSVSTQWQSRDDEASVATAVAAECWRHAAFTALTQRDLRRLCGLLEETGPGTNGHRHDPTPSSPSLSATPVASNPRRSSPPLVTHHEFFEMPPRWAMQSLGEVDQHTFHNFAEWDCRRLVTPLDVGATVVKQAMGAEAVVRGAAASAPGGDQTVSPAGPAASLYSPAQMMTERGDAAPPSSSYLSRTSASPSEAEHVLRRQERFRVRSTAAMARGAYWVDVVPLTAEEERDRREIGVAASTDAAISAVADTENNSITCERVDRDALLLHPPVALYVDPLLPCDELYSERGVNTSVYVFFLRALQQQQHKLADGRILCGTAASDSSSDCSGMRPGTGIGTPDPPEAAAALALQLALCARQRRLELASRIHRAINAANRSSVLRRVPSRAVATCVQAGTAVTSAKCSGLGAPAVSLQVRVDHARGSVQLRALTLEDSADSTSDALGSDWDASGRAATPTSSAAARPRLQDTETSSAAYTKRRREDAVEGEEAVRSSHNAAITKATRSPTVEVLLRSAWKLAALYDITRSASLELQQAERSASDESSEVRVTSPEGAQMRASLPASLSSWLATSLLRRLTGRPQAVSGLTASGTTGVHSEASCDSSWSTVVLHRGGACSPSTMPLAGERVPCPSLSAGRIDHSSASSPPLLLADDDPPTGVPAATAIASTTLTTTTTTTEERIFLGRLFTLLLRYRTLFGEHGYNQGPQAAVPPPVMEHLAAAFEISAEAFASPLNAQLPQFGSLFPDTDRHFGSMGSFFDLQFGGASGDCHAQRAPIPTDCAVPPPGCHIEVNPPFDTTLLRHMGTHLLSCLTRAQESTQSLLFLIVLPSHDLTDAEKAAAAVASTRLPTQAAAAKRLSSDRLRGSTAATASVPPSTERTLRESPYCLGHVLCAAAESAYVDGHQHLLQSPFFRIETPTRLILLGNTAARTRFPHATTQLEAVRAAWKEVTESALRQQR
ncbi:conserved hypothetical protein [Leishmania major strain Friedlin]|uniref:PCIF1 WW domain-containing protein n=1 Tax=Leishmania major TaxID=5664 RepID=Q4QE96_LEIMA|nr:conserved hypothetical protein [Leishmania major strain Friedlin]CAG9572327.1 Phosphorylated_CTD_interacting_factor_1_WW_domain_containing_protein_-_putative [Leishmania major strain Friedlin]CAJ03752.1 conserved hypothetical protein [Leishmania major strain Friedlin]|eukprot:XP_001682352.1 conserved hypothetical protein [Leishmania major strain Friedlin]